MSGGPGRPADPPGAPASEAWIEWRSGVRTRMLASAATGAAQLCVFEQLSDPGTGAPGHVHPGVEELLVVLAGEAEIWIGAERLSIEPGGSVVVPPSARHGFTNAGSGVLHTMAVFPVPSPPVRYDEEPETLYEVGAVRAEMRDAHRAVSERRDR